MDKATLNDLVTKARAGDADAMNDLINASYQDMYYYALKLVKKDDVAADATQDSCIEIIRKLSDLKESAAFVTWCRRIVYHQCTRRIGKSRVVPLEENEDGETILDRIPDENPGSLPEQIVEDRELRQTMLQMIDELPEGQRSALMLYYYEKLSVKQIAEIQDENENTIKSRLFQGRKAVKKQVEAYEAKTGTKLYSISILPLLYFLFHTGRAEADAAAASLAPQIQTAIAPAVAAASGTGIAAGTAAASSVAAKIIAGVLAVSLAAGGIAVGSYLSNQPSEESEPSTRHTKASTRTEPSTHTEPSTSVGDEEHIHVFEEWDYDGDYHWQFCDCGALTERSEHTYADGECVDCFIGESDLDCTVLNGKWINVAAVDSSVPMPEFYVNEEGDFVIDGTAYYPLAFADDESDWYDLRLFKNGEHGCCYSGWIDEQNGLYTLHLRENLAYETGELYVFYREEDYAGYEKVALTLENYSEYFTVEFQWIQTGYDNYNDAVRVWHHMNVSRRDGLGEPSYCRLEGVLQRETTVVEYGHSGDTTSDPDPVRTEEPISIEFLGHWYSEDVGESWSVNESGRYLYNSPKKLIAEKVIGYVLVPIE